MTCEDSTHVGVAGMAVDEKKQKEVKDRERRKSTGYTRAALEAMSQ